MAFVKRSPQRKGIITTNAYLTCEGIHGYVEGKLITNVVKDAKKRGKQVKLYPPLTLWLLFQQLFFSLLCLLKMELVGNILKVINNFIVTKVADTSLMRMIYS
jgi:hypothetical protein